MKVQLFYLFLLVTTTISCIPIKNAPNYQNGVVIKGKKFIKAFKSQNVFAFNDPKDANEFYTYINYKFKLIYDDDMGNVPITINETPAYLSFYEAEKTSSTFNLVPLLVDAALESGNIGSRFSNQYTSRNGQWYVVMTLTDQKSKDLLNSSHNHYQEAVSFLQSIRKEYLATSQYNELQFLKK